MSVTVATHNLAYGVVLGVIVAMVFFARRVAHFTEVVDVAHPDENTRVYAVRGALFFASSNDLVYQFDYADDPVNVIIDLVRGADLRLVDRRCARRDRAQVPPQGQAGRDRRHERTQRQVAPPQRHPRSQPLTPRIDR